MQTRSPKRSLVVTALAVAALHLSTPGSARAEHGMPVLVPAPASGQKLPRNGRIRLQSYNGVHWLVQELVAKGENLKVYFEGTAGKRVPIRTTDFYDDEEGGYGNSVLVVKPSTELAGNTVYSLVAEYMTDEGWKTHTLATYTTTGEVDKQKPRWRGRATRDTREHHQVVLAPLLPEKNLLHLVVELNPVKKGKKKRLIMAYDPSRICPGGPTVDYNVAIVNAACPDTESAGEICHTGTMFGHGKDDGRKFRAKLTAVDIAGNKKRAPGKGPIVTWSDHSITVCLTEK